MEPPYCPPDIINEKGRCPMEKDAVFDLSTCMPHASYLNSTSVNGTSTSLSHFLSNEREVSNIPKPSIAHIESKWEYPSPRMFYHALLRKGYETNPEDIDNMLFIHNQLNENVWGEILKWEQLARPASPQLCPITLKRFRGRSNALSPKAWFDKTFFNAPLPFDRHDWVIDRCGKEVRYIIDYYDNAPDAEGNPTINVSVRPALDTPSALYHRIRNLFHTKFT